MWLFYDFFIVANVYKMLIDNKVVKLGLKTTYFRRAHVLSWYAFKLINDLNSFLLKSSDIYFPW